MEEKKLTDEEIIKALECCTQEPVCNNCPIKDKDYCTKPATLFLEIVKLIKSQKAEIERLTYENRTIVSISNGFALERNNLRDEVNELKKEKRQLKKQVDELSQANIDLWNANQLGVKYSKNPYKGVEVE